MDEVIQITVLIAGRPYPLRVLARDEVLMHRLANEISEKVKEFQTKQPGRDKQDCLAMTCLALLVDSHFKNLPEDH